MSLPLEAEVAAAIRRHPFYANRTQVLHQWFCVFGNGMLWMDGAIVPKVSEERDETPQEWLRHIVLDVYDYLKDFRPDEYERRVRDYEQQCAVLTDRQERAAEIARTPGEVEHLADRSYGDGILLNSIPEDVRPDWAAAAQEITDYLNQHHPDWNGPRS